MKKNLIKSLIVFLFFPLHLFATTYEWKAYINKNEVYVNEAIYLRYECHFSDEAQLYAVDFNPVKSSSEFRVVMLSETSKIVAGKKILVYEFVAFVHHPEEMKFSFEALMKKTTQDSIENTVIGRDNGKYAEYQTTTEKLQQLTVNVLETSTPLVGTLEMHIKKDENSVKALHPYHLEVSVEGIGDFEALKPLAFDIEGVKVFSETPIVEQVLTQDGYKGKWSQKFAFVSEKDFTIKPFEWEYFDLEKKAKKLLKFDGVTVMVTQGIKVETLLDEPQTQTSYFSLEYLYYVLAFVAGFLVAKIEFKREKKEKVESFCTKVHSLKSLKELSVIVAARGDKKYEQILQDIEEGRLTSLQKAKKLICS
ncbi:MAG: BatD family protein [Campylobacterales bacterium]|nr:BatD family protein [Campylobacterales bacterium]